jgi:hypothetical protein
MIKWQAAITLFSMAAWLLIGTKQISNVLAKYGAKPTQNGEGGISDRAFDLADVGSVDIGLKSQLFLR